MPARDPDRRDGGSSARSARLGSEGTALRGRSMRKLVDANFRTSGDPPRGSAARGACRPAAAPLQPGYGGTEQVAQARPSRASGPAATPGAPRQERGPAPATGTKPGPPTQDQG
eukprot:7007871-Alexandrium_andersonii.AAC.1